MERQRCRQPPRPEAQLSGEALCSEVCFDKQVRSLAGPLLPRAQLPSGKRPPSPPGLSQFTLHLSALHHPPSSLRGLRRTLIPLELLFLQMQVGGGEKGELDRSYLSGQPAL